MIKAKNFKQFIITFYLIIFYAFLNSMEIPPDLLEAIRKGDIGIIKYHLGKGTDVNSSDDKGASILCLAVKEVDFELVDLLLKNGAAVNQPDDILQTPLIYAVENEYSINQIKIILLLISNNANLNDQNYNGDTSLMIAAKMGNYKCTETFVIFGADIFIKNLDDKTAFDIAFINSKNPNFEQSKRKEYYEIVLLIFKRLVKELISLPENTINLIGRYSFDTV